MDALGVARFILAPQAFGNTVLTLELMDDGGDAHGRKDRLGPHQTPFIVIPVNGPPELHLAATESSYQCKTALNSDAKLRRRNHGGPSQRKVSCQPQGLVL